MSQPTRPVAFRAGHPQVFVADCSEFQPDIADAAYLKWSKAIVIRALYGADHVDDAWYDGARRADIHAGGALFVGLYQFIVPDQDAAAQARALVDLLGPLRPGELPIGDLETGGAGQLARWDAWSQVIREAYGLTPGLYSGLDFARAQGLSPQWVAAYQSSPPDVPHLMWQFSESYEVPGVGVADCSVFSGTIAQLAAHAHQG
jgi:GH25 family lysozyme M1 (1,4-beta-N-acetylmuramidase)